MRIKEVEQDVVLRKEDFESLIGEMESLTETIEILSDRGLMEQIRESEKDIGKGNIFEIVLCSNQSPTSGKSHRI